MPRPLVIALCAMACTSKPTSEPPVHSGGEPPAPSTIPPVNTADGSATTPAHPDGPETNETDPRLRDVRADVEMICGAAKTTGGTDFMAVGPYIAEHMKTDLLADLFANIRTTTTLDMIVERVRAAMAKTHVEHCATIDVLLEHRPRQ